MMKFYCTWEENSFVNSMIVEALSYEKAEVKAIRFLIDRGMPPARLVIRALSDD